MNGNRVAACIVKKDTVAWQGYYGYASLAQNIPVTDSTIFMLASTSKTVTAAASTQLYEAGHFQLEHSENHGDIRGGDNGVTTAMFLWENDRTGIVFLSNLSSDQFSRETVVERLTNEADALTVGVQQAYATIPEQFQLLQNFPNPFNPSTTIRYGLPNRSRVTLCVFNALGQQVTLLQNGEGEAGYHEVKFDALGLTSGVYFYRVQVRPLTVTSFVSFLISRVNQDESQRSNR